MMTSAQCWATCVSWFHSYVAIFVMLDSLMIFDLWRRNRRK